MERKTDLEYAFPNDYRGNGMSLRDYFAAAAMQGDLSNEADEVLTWEDIAKRAYKMADAMLEERMKSESN